MRRCILGIVCCAIQASRRERSEVAHIEAELRRRARAQPARICTGTWGSPHPHLHQDFGLIRPHLHRDWAHPAHNCTRTLGSALPHLHQDFGLSLATSALGLCAHPAHICTRTLGSAWPDLRWDLARPAHICTGTSGPALPHLRRDWARPAHICAGTARGGRTAEAPMARSTVTLHP